MRKSTSLLVLGLLLFLQSALGCRGTQAYFEPQRGEPELYRRRVKDRKTGNTVRSWTVLVYPDGRSVKHGPDQHWYPSGARLSEGTFENGEPSGRLRRWYENGQLRSEFTFRTDSALAPMEFWHENGQLAASGHARLGKREGFWSFWHGDGAPRERGGYIEGRRSGRWSFYHEDGSVASSGNYDAGERVGRWQHYLPGERFDQQADT